MNTYYVVKKGNNVGIFKTWGECKKSVDGYKNPVFRKFDSYEEASLFYKGNKINKSKASLTLQTSPLQTSPSTSPSTSTSTSTSPSTSTSQNIITDQDIIKMKQSVSNIKSSHYSDDLNYNINGWTNINNEIYIFTDGSSRKSKTNDDFNCGIGVFLGFACTNIKEQYTDNKTNNQCELMALDYSFKLIIRYYRELIDINKTIKIVSDSEYSIKSISVWLATWKKNNWKTKSNEDVKNRNIIESIDASMQRIKLINSKINDKKIKVKLIHVNSHQQMDRSNKVNFDIWVGNLCADGLACNKI